MRGYRIECKWTLVLLTLKSCLGSLDRHTPRYYDRRYGQPLGYASCVHKYCRKATAENDSGSHPVETGSFAQCFAKGLGPNRLCAHPLAESADAR